MGSITSPSPGVADLLQILTSAGSTSLSSTLSSSSIQSALQNAPTADLVQLSDQALQLQVVDGLFASPDQSQTEGLFGASPSSATSILDSILAGQNPSAAGSTTSNTSATTTPAPSLADQFAAYQSQLQSEQVQALLGTNTNVLA